MNCSGLILHLKCALGHYDWEVRLSQPAVLALEDGTLFRGLSIGASGTTVGEVVFNTAMTGYQEILTDPSYCRQIVTLTYPHIGNTGTTREDEESSRIQAAGLIVRDLPLLASNFRSEQNLSEYLTQHNTVAIDDIDTRKLTRILRDGGAQRLLRSFAAGLCLFISLTLLARPRTGSPFWARAVD